MSTEPEKRNQAVVREVKERRVRLENGRIVQRNAEAGFARAIFQARD